MKIRITVAIARTGALAGVLCGLSGTADAAQPTTSQASAAVRAEGAPPLSARNLAAADSLLKYCAKADAKDSGKIDKQIKAMVKAAPAETVAQIRKTAEYKVAYDQASVFLDKVDPRNVQMVCTRPLPKGEH